MNALYSGPFSRVVLVKPSGSSGLAFALNPIPLGLESITANIRELVDDILIYDQFMEKESLQRVLSWFKPDLVGFSMSATEHYTGGELMQAVKNFDPKIPIIAGGYHPTGTPELVLNDIKCDAVCRGEGEILFKEFVQGDAWERIEGLSYKLPENGKEIIHNKDRPFIKDLDTLPFPARNLRKRRGYHYKNVLVLNREYDLMEFGRGCYGKCTFCCEPYFSQGRQRYRSPERTMEEIRTIWEFHGGNPLRILIADPNILGNFRKVDSLCDLLLEADLDITFQVMTRTESIVKHPDIVEKMIRAGMISWELGIESFTQDDLDTTLKHIPVEVQTQAVAILRQLGGEPLGTFVIGLPNHTQKFIKRFPNYARKIGLSAAAFGIATPFPGTGFWNELSSQDLIFEQNWAKFDENHSVFRHPLLSPDAIENLRNWCMGNFWNLDAILEQIRLDENRVGKFRAKYKVNLRDFIIMVIRKLNFAVEAGSELAEKGDGNTESNYYKSVRFVFDAWANPRMKQYFQKHPMHEIIDMRQFGKLFAGKRLQVVIEDAPQKKCLFAMLITVSKKGIDSIITSKKPSLDYDFLIRADLKSLYTDPTLSRTAQLKRTLQLFSRGEVRITGLRTLFKLILYGFKEFLSFRLNNGKL
ncbi:MAG: B12-binding domain-containing radical SAM protein [Candidatus Helarchaeota archaeon]|nr:B12-binding domain-containing radical SAM protein [Candidatus Helarchaeota archaeon]